MSTEKQSAQANLVEQVRGWFTGRLPDDWFVGAPEILVDREEITVVGAELAARRQAAGGPGRASGRRG